MWPEHLVRLAERLCDRLPEVRVVGVHPDRWPGGGSIAVNGDTFPVRWCSSRLAVSQRLSALAEGELPIVVTPLTDADLGLDVLARLARKRLPYPEPWQMVRDAYGVSSKEEPRPTHARLPLAELVQPVSTEAPQPDLFAVAEAEQSVAAARWDRLLTSEVYAAQRALAAKGAPHDSSVRAALDALNDADGRLPALSLGKRLGAEPGHARRAVDGLQRLLNVDGYPVLRLGADGANVELDAALLVEQFGLKP